jgi:uncharacterized membrane protein YtjA (UPF0391 family)
MTAATSLPHAPGRGAAQLSWGIAFLIIALVAALFGFGGIASAVSGIAKLLFFLERSHDAPGSLWFTGRCSLEIVENGKPSKFGLIVRGGCGQR